MKHTIEWSFLMPCWWICRPWFSLRKKNENSMTPAMHILSRRSDYDRETALSPPCSHPWVPHGEHLFVLFAQRHARRCHCQCHTVSLFPALSLTTKHGTTTLNTLRPRQNDHHFPDDIFDCIFLNENIRISLEILLKFVPRRLINNIPALVQIMGWRRSGDKPLSEPKVFSLLMHICVTRPYTLTV